MGGLIDIFTGSWKTSNKVAEVLIAPLDRDGNIDYNLSPPKILQFWPESLSEDKAPNWQSKEIPGSPLPLYQWMAGGERPFSFTAVFSRDMDGEIGKDFKEDKYNVDIDAAKAWLYLLSSSDYEEVQDMKLAVAPPILFLTLFGSKIGYNSSNLAPTRLTDNMSSGVHCIMTGLSMETKNWFPSGRPKLMSANLTFAEVIQIGKGIYPYGRRNLKALASKYTRTHSGR